MLFCLSQDEKNVILLQTEHCGPFFFGSATGHIIFTDSSGAPSKSR